MGKILETRRNKTTSRFQELQKELQEAEKLVDQKACVYATGSFGRVEASEHSDLDLFIVGEEETGQRKLSKINEILLEADLIEATQKLGIPEFSGDGEYLLVHYTKKELIETLGKPHDDANNTFTARLLMLLESRALLGSTVYKSVIEEVVAAYWRDFADHKNEFVPAFLANDILRLWRTFCVNYEARTLTEPPEKKAKRKLKNFKLKHSRLLTCYSALLYLLAIFGSNKSVRPEDAINMSQLSPTARLEWLLSRNELSDAHATVRGLLDHYENFLAATNYSESELIQRFLDGKEGKKLLQSANEFGNLTFTAIEQIGQRNAFHRVLLV
jgi:predicted nucleotidyltransferase